MADVDKIVGTGGGAHYATWTLFIAAIQVVGDISAATGTGDRWRGFGQNEAFNEQVDISGIVTDTTNRVVLAYDTGAALDGRSRDVSGTGCQINYGTSFVIRNQIEHLTIDGIDIAATSNIKAIDLDATTYSAGNDVKLLNSIIHNTGTSTSIYTIAANDADLVLTMENTIVYGVSRSMDGRSGTRTINYCTFWRHNDQLGPLLDSNATVKNCYSGKATGSSEDWWTGATAPSGSHNASSDTSASTDYTNTVTSAAGANQFVSVTSGSEDFTLKSGSALEGAGTPIGGITTDIIGTSRDGTTPDIGAFEFVSAGGATIPVFINHYRNQGIM